MADFAFVTLVTSDHYLPGALAVVGALKDVHPQPPIAPEVPFKTVCLVSPETVDVNTIKHLRRAFDVVIGVEVIEGQTAAELQLLGRPDLHSVLTKLHVFRLTQYDKIIFLDADVLPLRSLSHLFTLPHEFSAVPDVGWPDIFNSGVMVLTPGHDKFESIMELVRSKGSWDGGDQGVLNEWRGNDWHRLSFTYNTTPTATYTYAPAYQRFGSKISALHFIGPNKPWGQIPYRAPSSKSQESSAPSQALPESVDTSSTLPIVEAVPQQTYGYSALVDRWFDVYDRHYRRKGDAPSEEFKEQKYESVWNEVTTIQPPSQGASPGSGGPMNLEELRKVAVEGSSVGLPQKGIGEYRSLPLEGRIDLMRPPKPEPPVPQPTVGHTPSSSGEASSRHQEDQPPLSGVQLTQSSTHHSPSRVTPPPHPEAESYRPQTSSPGHLDGGSSQLEHGPTTILHTGAHDASQPRSATSPSQNVLPEPSTPWSPPTHPPPSSAHTNYSAPPVPPAEPPRPASPPLLLWNPAVEPPPNVPPPITAFPTTAYFPNVWDLTPGSSRLHSSLTGTTVPEVSGFFEPPPAQQIPQRLINEGHYANVMGPQSQPQDYYQSQHGHGPHVSHAPQPQPLRVQLVFPWEEKPRHTPTRAFPKGEKPPAGTKYIEDIVPEPVPEPVPVKPDVVDTPNPDTKPKMHIEIPPPSMGGFPSSKSYKNAWDAVPSIQRYAANLVKPPAIPTNSPPTVFIGPPGSRRRSNSYRSRGEQSDANSMDGDVEDEVDDDDESRTAGGRLSGSEHDDLESDDRQTRSRSGSASKGSKKKEYRSYGVQTIPKEVRSIGVQVSLTTPPNQIGKQKLDESPGSANGIAPTVIGNGRRGLPRHSPKIRSRRESSTTTSTPPTAVSSPSQSQNIDLPQIHGGIMSPTFISVQPLLRSSRSTGGSPQLSPGVMSPRMHEQYSYGSPTRTPVGSPGSVGNVAMRPPQITTSVVESSSAARVVSGGGGKSGATAPSITLPVARTSSTETAESPGPDSPADTFVSHPGVAGSTSVTGAGARRTSRQWNPATGLDVFKRGSEEVLARFLRMGSWDESPTHTQPQSIG